MAKKIIKHSYHPLVNTYKSWVEIQNTTPVPPTPPSHSPEPQEEDPDDRDSAVELVHNRFHLDDSVMIIYNKDKDQLIVTKKQH